MGGIEEGHITTFIKSWKELNKYVGVIQVDCKVYGKMNEQLNSTSPIISFLV
jgi:Na+-transporting NADH:ubiquinone oxidoreductase subunit NqrD